MSQSSLLGNRVLATRVLAMTKLSLIKVICDNMYWLLISTKLRKNIGGKKL